MCGILLIVGQQHDAALSENRHLQDLVDRRGPDGTRIEKLQIRSSSGAAIPLTFVASVLSLRGNTFVSQPLVDAETKSVFCWNGEAWKVGDVVVQNNDTIEVFNGILAASRRSHGDDLDSSKDSGAIQVDHVARYLASISGPAAFVFYDAPSSKLYFGRDFLGRRSLLFKSSPQSFILSSTGDQQDGWTELDSKAIYTLEIGEDQCDWDDATHQLVHDDSCLMQTGLRVFSSTWDTFRRPMNFNRTLPQEELEYAGVSSEAVNILERLLVDAVGLRVQPLFAQQNGTTLIPGSESTTHHPMAIKDRKTCNPRYAVLFSGGLDCSVVARLLHDQLSAEEEIDLLNVAFENPRLQNRANDTGCSPYDLCPDRGTARKSFRELCQICPLRKWRLVEIDVPFKEFKAHRELIVSLMHPHDTEMDLSIATALYFAARAEGWTTLNNNGARKPYKSIARVLFSGLGADELFGGYQRHATAFYREGYDALLDALELDVNRLGKRNLGRDDRVISHWGKEARYPYLDEQLLQWAIEAPVWEKCGFGQITNDGDKQTTIEPDKQVLRKFAAKLGLQGAASEKKRAIQFGARTAKMESRSKGTELIGRPGVST